ncbi:MAG: alpha/beta hydrolase [Faecousia sp.]
MIVVWILLGVCALLLLAGLVVFRIASVGKPPAPLDDLEKLEKIIGHTHAELVKEGLAWLSANPPQEVTMESFDGLTLRGRWSPVENARATMVMVHGWHGSVETDFCAIFDTYHKMGFNMLMIDQRGQNGSGGRFMTFGVKESRDVADWVRYHNEHLGNFPVILDGISMGATSVLMAMGQALPANVRGVLADCGFTSPWEILCQVAKQKAHVASFPLLDLARLWCRLLAGYDPKAESTVTAMAHSNLPILLVHGTADHFVPSRMSQAAYDAYRGPKELILVENAGHGMSYVVDKPRVQDALERFAETVLKA